MTPQSSAVTPKQAVEIFRKSGVEPPDWLLVQAGLKPKPQEIPDEREQYMDAWSRSLYL